MSLALSFALNHVQIFPILTMMMFSGFVNIFLKLILFPTYRVAVPFNWLPFLMFGATFVLETIFVFNDFFLSASPSFTLFNNLQSTTSKFYNRSFLVRIVF